MKQITTFILLFVSIVTFAQDINQFDTNGKRHGIWKKTFKGTQQIRYQGAFVHGKEVGEFKFYKLMKKKSVLTATKQYNTDDNSAYVKFLSSRGKTISDGKMLGKLYIGQWKYYHNGTDAIMTLEHYNDEGYLQGEKLVYYKDGQIAERANYINGKLQGESNWYSIKGVVLKAFIYDNDELHGISKYYDPNGGELIAEGNYKRGKKAGLWKYYENGKLTEEKDFSAVIIRKKKQ